MREAYFKVEIPASCWRSKHSETSEVVKERLFDRILGLRLGLNCWVEALKFVAYRAEHKRGLALGPESKSA